LLDDVAQFEKKFTLHTEKGEIPMLRNLTRRDFVKTTAAAGAATVAYPGHVNAAGEKVVRIRARTDIKSIDTARTITTSDYDVRQAVLNNLVLYKSGDAWTTENDAAEYIEQISPTETAFTLREGIMWTNGYGEMTAEDVKYSYERMKSDELQATDRQEWEQLEEVRVTGRYSGVIVMTQPVANLWTNTLPRGMGAIVCKKAWEEHDGWTTALGNNIPCSSGPYKMTEWQQETRVVLERNELWTGPQPYFDKVEFIVISDDNAAELAFLAGELDIAWVSVGSGAFFRDEPPENTDVVIRPTTGFAWIGINTEHEPFDDIRVREAIRKAIDFETVIEAGYFGLSPVSTGVLAPGVLGYKEREIPGRDVEGAKALLAEAGFPNGFSTTLVSLNNTSVVDASQVVQANLAEIGIEVEVLPTESGTYWSLGLESEGDDWKDIQMVYQEWTSAPDPRRATQWFVCDQVGEWNWQRWCSDRYSELDELAGAETDLEKRAAMYEEMMDEMWNSAAFLNITHPVRVVLVRDNIDPQMLPNGYIYFRSLTVKT